VTEGWSWDETLFAGTAAHYRMGRMAYPPRLAEVLREELGLDGRGRLLDVGCGPGSVTLLLAPLFASAVGVDADAGMVAAAARCDAPNVRWLQLRAEELPAGLGTFRAVTFAQAFHWMDQARVAASVRDMIEPGGAWVHIRSDTHRGAPGEDRLPRPRPPWDRVEELFARYLGPVRRAGQGLLPGGTRGGEEDVMRAAGYRGPTRLEAGGGEIQERSVEEVTAAVLSLSSSAPHLFGQRLPEFQADLRALLDASADQGWFAERRLWTTAVVWRP
jgi:SAM-dependent methyltransferase